MNKSKFIYYKAVDKILENNYFFGFTAKRNKEANMILYTYRSVKYPNVLINVLTMRLDPSKIQSDKIVLGIKFNDIEIGGWNDFINELKHVYKYNKQKNYNYGNAKKIDTIITVVGAAVSTYQLMTKAFKWYERKYDKGKDKKILQDPLLKEGKKKVFIKLVYPNAITTLRNYMLILLTKKTSLYENNLVNAFVINLGKNPSNFIGISKDSYIVKPTMTEYFEMSSLYRTYKNKCYNIAVDPNIYQPDC